MAQNKEARSKPLDLLKVLELLAVVGHGGGCVISSLGLAYHVSLEQTIFDRDVAIHAFLLWYHGNAVAKHAKRLQPRARSSGAERRALP
jgi:hypothetical protein